MRPLLVLLFAAFSQAELASCSGPSGTALGREPSQSMEAPVRLCSEAAVFDVSVAKRLRDELSPPHVLGNERLSQVSQALDSALTQCTGGLDLPNAQFVGALYILLGNQFLSEGNYLPARQTFESANRFYSGLAVPSLGWLEALRGAARAEVRLGDFRSAESVASRQTELARSWVSRRGFVRDALVDALRFEAEVRHAEGQSEKAKDLASEADQLEARQ